MPNVELNNRIPLQIQNEEELRKLWAAFKEHMLQGKSGHVNENQKTRLTGAGLFVDFLCGIPLKKKTSRISYLNYPDKPWPLD